MAVSIYLKWNRVNELQSLLYKKRRKPVNIQIYLFCLLDGIKINSNRVLESVQRNGHLRLFEQN